MCPQCKQPYAVSFNYAHIYVCSDADPQARRQVWEVIENVKVDRSVVSVHCTLIASIWLSLLHGCRSSLSAFLLSYILDTLGYSWILSAHHPLCVLVYS